MAQAAATCPMALWELNAASLRPRTSTPGVQPAVNTSELLDQRRYVEVFTKYVGKLSKTWYMNMCFLLCGFP